MIGNYVVYLVIWCKYYGNFEFLTQYTATALLSTYVFPSFSSNTIRFQITFILIQFVSICCNLLCINIMYFHNLTWKKMASNLLFLQFIEKVLIKTLKSNGWTIPLMFIQFMDILSKYNLILFFVTNSLA